jgi:hypothetical protein
MTELRTIIEREETGKHWGYPYRIVPRLIERTFGDGSQLIAVEPLNTRPNYFMVRVDSAPDWDIREVLDDIIDAAEEEFGYYDDECLSEDEKVFPIADWSAAFGWGMRFPVAELLVNVYGDGI